jgi:MFS transporter, OFA family, oxalate/formate antiporter
VGLGLATGTGPLLDPFATAFGTGRGAVSSMFSATLFLLLGTGLVAGPAAARYGTRAPALVGSVLVPGGLVAAAVADAFGPAAVAFAVGVGGGAGCLFVPLLAAVGTAFHRRRSVALVLATAGGGLGTVIAPTVLLALLPVHGLRTTLLLLAAGSAAVLLACAATAGDRGTADVGERGPGPIAVLRDPGFRLLSVGSVGICAAMFVPFVHLAADTAARGPGAATGALLVAVVGGASVVGRVAAIPLVARVGAWPVQRVAALVLTAALLLWLPSGGGVLRLGVFAVVFGLAHGAWVGLSAAVAAERHGTVGLASRLAVLHAAAAVGGLVGPGAAGWAADLLGTPAAAPAVAVVLGAAGCAALLALGRQAGGGPDSRSAGARQATAGV